MELTAYQNEAMRTAIYPIDRGLEYAILGLTSEAGEIAGAYKKIIRDKDGHIDADSGTNLIKELGDVLWYAAAVARELNTSLEVVAQMNLNKLASRQARGVLGGNGDHR